MEKDGQFDWILSYNDIKHYFNPSGTGINLDHEGSKLLVIGCGTSPMSECIAQDFPRCTVVSIDNDAECISHMRKECKTPRTEWYRYDIIEDCGVPQGNVMDNNNYFDLVVDKGTFDAVLVEGATYKMLADIHRLLRIGGVYMLFSINTQKLLTALFGLTELQFEVAYHEDKQNKCSILLCRKRSDDTIDMECLAEKEDLILDQYFKSEHPLVTAELVGKINEGFSRVQRNGCSGGFIPLKDAYHIMFVANNAHLCYTYDLFQEDLAGITLTHSGLMSAEEAVQFLNEVQ